MPCKRIEQEYISRVDVASLLGLTGPVAVDLAAQTGRLKAYKFGRTVRFRRDEVEAALIPVSAA